MTSRTSLPAAERRGAPSEKRELSADCESSSTRPSRPRKSLECLSAMLLQPYATLPGPVERSVWSCDQPSVQTQQAPEQHSPRRLRPRELRAYQRDLATRPTLRSFTVAFRQLGRGVARVPPVEPHGESPVTRSVRSRAAVSKLAEPHTSRAEPHTSRRDGCSGAVRLDSRGGPRARRRRGCGGSDAVGEVHG